MSIIQKTKPRTRKTVVIASRKPQKWHLRLYVAGHTPRSLAAMTNLRKICDEHLAGQYTIEVIDLVKNPQLAAGDQIFAIPTLVRMFPEPMKRIIGDLSDSTRTLVGLDLREAGPKKGA